MKKYIVTLLVALFVFTSVPAASALVRYAPRPTTAQRTIVIRRHWVHERASQYGWQHDRFGMPYRIVK